MTQRRPGSTTEEWTPARRRQHSKILKRTLAKKAPGMRGPLQREALKITDKEFADAWYLLAVAEFERRASSYGNMSRKRFAEVAEDAMLDPGTWDAVRARLKNGEMPDE